MLCVAFLVGFVDKLNFLWVIARVDRRRRAVMGRRARGAAARRPRRWQPLIAGVTVALLVWGAVTLVRRAARLDILGDAAALTLAAQLAARSGTFTRRPSAACRSSTGCSAPMCRSPSAFNIVLLVQLAAAVVAARVVARPWTPARRLLAFLTAATAFLRRRHRRHAPGRRLASPLHAVADAHAASRDAARDRRAAPRHRARPAAWRCGRTVATCGAIVCGALLAWNIAMDLRYVDTWRNDRDYRPLFDPAIAKLGKRLDRARRRSRDLGRLGPAPAAGDAGRPRDAGELSRMDVAAHRRRPTSSATICAAPSPST